MRCSIASNMTVPHIQPFTLGPYQTNCFVITPDAPQPQMPCWIIDCGFEPEEMFDWIESQQLRPAAILLTHSHLDHIAGVDQALSRFSTSGGGARLPLYIHDAEANFCSDAMLNLSALIGMPVTCTEPNHYLKDGDTLNLDGPPHAQTWRVLHTPGHSPGGIAYIHDQSKQAIVGDTLFHDSIGRFDFPTSNADHLRHTIQHVMMSLPDDMTIYPGHGPKTTIGRERRHNPYVRGGF
jgi:hydroxyacylglutathione hydrolase